MDEQSCDCCEGTQVLTPVNIVNRPGLSALAYRVGTHARFFETLKAKLSSQIIDVPRAGDTTQSDPAYPLRNLTTRASDDAAIALLDGWATVADVLTFYQERIANEGYLRTATERRSVLELARLVGYTLRPGVASTVYLAYTIDENHKAPTELPIGTRAQSVPIGNDLPQAFETSEVLDARASWNTLKPRLTRPQTMNSIKNFLFSIGLSFKDDLDGKTLSLGLRTEFEKQGIFLSLPDANGNNGATVTTVPTVPPDNLWQIFDPVQRQSYVIILNTTVSPERLDIHLNQNDRMYLKGITTNLKPNDPLLIGFEVFRVKEVKPDAAADRTLIVFQSTAGLPPSSGLSSIADLAAAALTVGAADIQRAYAQTLAEIAARQSDPDEIKKTFKVDPASGMAVQVIQILADLRTQATAEVPPEQLAKSLQATSIVQLRQQLTTAADAGYNRLEAWISAIIIDLDQATAKTLEAAANAAPAATAALVAPAQLTRPDVFLNVLNGLSIPPTVPVSNTLQLTRSVSDSFAADNDSAIQVVNAVRPDFKAILPVALSSVQVSQAKPLEVFALRSKTGVYGSTAPLKPIRDSQNGVIGMQEWPLNGTQTVGVTLNFQVNYKKPPSDLLHNATISVTGVNVSSTLPITLHEQNQTPTELPGVTFHF